jgi:branched-chain amino acid transport system substrate-binding protein
VEEFFYLALETDFRPQLQRIREFRPDVLFLPGSFPDATLVAAQSEQAGLRVTLLGADGWSSPFLFQKGGPPGEAYYLELCSPAPEFDRRYEETEAAGLRSLGRLPEGATGASLGETRRRLRDAVARNEVDGATGRIRFDAHGDRRQGVALYAVEKSPLGPPRPVVRGWLGEP